MSCQPRLRRALRFVLRFFAWLFALPFLGVVLLVVTGPASWSALAYVAAMGVVLWGLAFQRHPRFLTRGGTIALVLVALVRCGTGAKGTSMAMEEVTSSGLRSPAPSRLSARLVDEADVAVAGTRVLVAGGMLHDDASELPGAMRGAYAKMRREEGDSPSPVVPTYLGLNDRTAFDLLVVPPRDASSAASTNLTRPDVALVFLHGFAGSFELPCWQMARAVEPLGVLTACPSTRWVGDWWTREGEAIVRRTVDILRARGVKTFILAGLSNGGYGASRLAPRLHGLFAGLILISGAAPDAGRPGMPALVIHGAKDSMAPYSEATGYRARTGAKLVTLDAGHFAMLVRSEQNDAAVRSFVGDLTRRGSALRRDPPGDRRVAARALW